MRIRCKYQYKCNQARREESLKADEAKEAAFQLEYEL